MEEKKNQNQSNYKMYLGIKFSYMYDFKQETGSIWRKEGYKLNIVSGTLVFFSLLLEFESTYSVYSVQVLPIQS